MPGPPRRILLIINALASDGGAENQVTHLAVGLAERGNEVTVCCIYRSILDPRVFADAGVKLVSLGIKNRLGRVLAVPRLARLARKADVVQCTMWDASLWGRLAAIIARRPVVIADHTTDRRVQVSASGAPRARWIAVHNRLLDPFTAATVACATSQREVLEGEGVSAEKIVHIPNGIPVAALRAQALGTTRAGLGLPADVPLVLQVGVFRPEKNQIGALEAFVGVRRRVPDAHLAFAGDGPSRPEVERRAAELGLADGVHFLGNRDDIGALIAASDLVILPSTADAMPMTLIEAMAIGRPIVASDVGDVAMMLDGEAGVLVPPGEMEALAEAISALLLDPERRERIGAAGRQIGDSFDAAAMVASYEAIFDAAVAGSAPRS